MLGKTYLALKDVEKARLWLTKARDYRPITPEDKEVGRNSYTLPSLTAKILYCNARVESDYSSGGYWFDFPPPLQSVSRGVPEQDTT